MTAHVVTIKQERRLGQIADLLHLSCHCGWKVRIASKAGAVRYADLHEASK